MIKCILLIHFLINFYCYTGLNAERLEASVIFDDLTQNRFAQGNLIVRKINTSDNPADLITRLKAELGQ